VAAGRLGRVRPGHGCGEEDDRRAPPVIDCDAKEQQGGLAAAMGRLGRGKALGCLRGMLGRDLLLLG
jgi:hypothetical protein